MFISPPTQNDHRRSAGYLLQRVGRLPVPAGRRLSLYQREFRPVSTTFIMFGLGRFRGAYFFLQIAVVYISPKQTALDGQEQVNY